MRVKRVRFPRSQQPWLAMNDAMWRFGPSGGESMRSENPHEYDDLTLGVLHLLAAGRSPSEVAQWLSFTLMSTRGQWYSPSGLGEIVDGFFAIWAERFAGENGAESDS